MKTLRTPSRWVLLGTCVGVLISLLSIARAQCTRNCGLPPPGSFVTLYSFNGPPDGARPTTRLVRDTLGNFYGTTEWGGVTGGVCGTVGCGVVFKLDTAGKETVLYSFTGTGGDGTNPRGDLVPDVMGNLYGTTEGGGVNNGVCGTLGCGVVFKVDTTGKETVLYSFKGGSGDGSQPLGSLLQDASGNLYGTTSVGGPSGGGVVFKLDPTGTETVLHSFNGAAGSTDGVVPQAGLVPDTSGNFYGTISEGGGIFNCSIENSSVTKIGCGAVFKLDTTDTETVLYSFAGSNNDGPDGAFPNTNLVRDSSGNLYGTTLAGGRGTCYTIATLPPTPTTFIRCGTVFKLGPTGTETVVHSFTGGLTNTTDPHDGASPQGGLVLDGSGNLYGTTFYGGAAHCVVSGGRPGTSPVDTGCGTVFKVDTTGTETVLHSFTGTGEDGGFPHAGLILDAGGNLYGTTTFAGNANFGTVFELTGTTTATPADFSVAPASSSLTVQSGGQVTDAITVTSQNGTFASAVELSCAVAGPAPMPTCALSPTSVTPGTNSASSTLTVTAPAGTALLAPSIEEMPKESPYAMLLLMVLGTAVVAGSRKQRPRSWVLDGFFLTLFLSMVACGGGSSSGTRVTKQPTNYTVTVTGASTATSGNIQHSTQVTVTVP